MLFFFCQFFFFQFLLSNEFRKFFVNKIKNNFWLYTNFHQKMKWVGNTMLTAINLSTPGPTSWFSWKMRTHFNKQKLPKKPNGAHFKAWNYFFPVTIIRPMYNQKNTKYKGWKIVERMGLLVRKGFVSFQKIFPNIQDTLNRFCR